MMAAPIPGGAPIPTAPDVLTLPWVNRTFAAYYAANPPPLPTRFARREFGFLWNGKKFFLRHTSFPNSSALHNFLIQESPSHCYYSTAYYKTPHAPTMKEKEWQGADLIFDLDADHLAGADKMSYPEMLRAVRSQARKLLDQFILGDLGFEPQHVRIVFSGARGYHFHITDPRVLSLDSAARREIIDYISPNDTIRASLVNAFAIDQAWAGEFGIRKQRTIPPASTPGWKGLLTRNLVQLLENVRAAPTESEALSLLTSIDGIGNTTAHEILRLLTPERITRMRDDGLVTIPALSNKRVLHGLVRAAAVEAEGETDEPVTTDTKRLIRLPHSLHGKTGLAAMPLTIDQLPTFDPLRDAIALDDEPVRVHVTKRVDIPLHGFNRTVDPGDHELPSFAATFAILRRAANMREPSQ